jgi:hypothetical protein
MHVLNVSNLEHFTCIRMHRGTLCSSSADKHLMSKQSTFSLFILRWMSTGRYVGKIGNEL